MILFFVILLYLKTELVSAYGYNYGVRNSRKHTETLQYCPDLSPYFGDINLDQIAGVWYGVEKIHHARGEYRIEYSEDCFYIDIKELYSQPTTPPPYGYDERHLSNYNYNNNPPYMLTTSPYVHRNYGLPEPPRIRYFHLEWHENVWKDDYHVKVNTSHKGFWPADTSDRSVDQMYRNFGGVIQVLKMGDNHLVLNFCKRLPHSQLFSVIFSRHEHQLSAEDINIIHNMFTIKQLSTSSMKRVCGNSASSANVSSLILLIGFLVWRSQQ